MAKDNLSYWVDAFASLADHVGQAVEEHARDARTKGNEYGAIGDIQRLMRNMAEFISPDDPDSHVAAAMDIASFHEKIDA